MNRMQVKPDYTLEMDVLGLRRRHDETFLTLTDHQQSPKEDSMRYHDTFSITRKTLGLKDEPAGDQFANSTADKFAQYMRTRPDDVAAAVARLGVNASISEVVLALDAQTAPPRTGRSYLLDQFNAFTEKCQREDFAKRVLREYQAAQAVPLNKRIVPGAGRICTG